MTKAAELAKMGEVLTNSQIGGRRNIVINGAMQVAQRGTSSSGLGASGGYFTMDRMLLDFSGTAGRLTMSQSTDAPNGFANSLKLDCTTADTSIAAAETGFIQYRIEGQDLQQFKKGTSDAEKMTVSFYVKGNGNATYICELYDGDNARQISKTFAVTSSWNRVVLTYDGDTTGAFDDDNALSLYIIIWIHSGSNFNSGTLSTTWTAQTAANRAVGGSSFFSSTDNELYITGLQMEIGEQATPFEHRSFGEELALCHRYYQQFSGDPEAYAGTEADAESCGAGVWYGSSQILGMLAYKAPMRTAPSISFVEAGTTTAAGDWGSWYGYQVGKTSNDTSAVDVITSDNARFNFDTSASGSTNGGGTYGLVRDGKQIKIDAEL